MATATEVAAAISTAATSSTTLALAAQPNTTTSIDEHRVLFLSFFHCRKKRRWHIEMTFNPQFTFQPPTLAVHDFRFTRVFTSRNQLYLLPKIFIERMKKKTHTHKCRNVFRFHMSAFGIRKCECAQRARSICASASSARAILHQIQFEYFLSWHFMCEETKKASDLWPRHVHAHVANRIDLNRISRNSVFACFPSLSQYHDADEDIHKLCSVCVCLTSSISPSRQS